MNSSKVMKKVTQTTPKGALMSITCTLSTTTETDWNYTFPHTPKPPSTTTVVTCPCPPVAFFPRRRRPFVNMPSKSKHSAPKPSRESMVRVANLACPDGEHPVDARWQIAWALVCKLATRRLYHRVLDSYVENAVKYIRSLNSCKTDKDLDRIAKRMPHLHAAHLLCESSDMPVRGLVEASLLAGMSIQQTAVACNLPAETIEWYEAMFFRVIRNQDCGSACFPHEILAQPQRGR